MMVGLTDFFVITAGACPELVDALPNAGTAAAAASPAVLVTTKSRREILSVIGPTSYGSGLRMGSVIVDYLLLASDFPRHHSRCGAEHLRRRRPDSTRAAR